MPIYKDTNTGTWYVKTYYTDYTGTKKQKMKRGFKLQREAKEWEHDFLLKQAGEPSMPFKTLCCPVIWLISKSLPDCREHRR